MAANAPKTSAKTETAKKAPETKTPAAKTKRGGSRPRRTLDQRLADLLDQINHEQTKLAKASEEELAEAVSRTEDVRVRALIAKEVKARRARRTPLDDIIQSLDTDEQVAVVAAAAESTLFGMPTKAPEPVEKAEVESVEKTADADAETSDAKGAPAQKTEGDPITEVFGSKA